MVLKYWEIRVPELALGAVPRTGAEMKVFEPFRLDPVNHCLWRAEERVLLTPKAFDVLRYLVDHADRLVPQDEILEALWPETYVNPEGIRKYILEIRKVLGDRPDHPTFIETLPKRTSPSHDKCGWRAVGVEGCAAIVSFGASIAAGRA